MRMRIDAAGHDVTARSVNGFIAGQIITHGNNLLAFDENVGFKGAVGSNNCAALDHFTGPRTYHVRVPLFGFVSNIKQYWMERMLTHNFSSLQYGMKKHISASRCPLL